MSKHDRFKKRCQDFRDGYVHVAQVTRADFYRLIWPGYDQQEYVGRFPQLADMLAGKLLAITESAFNDGWRAAKEDSESDRKPPDSQERINSDAMANPMLYCKVCHLCRGCVFDDGMECVMTSNCSERFVADLLRRQRELCAEGGEE